MSTSWFPIDVCVGGTAFFRYNAEMLLPQEPQELEDAWQRRVSRATMTPFTVRIAEQAAGLVLRKPIVLESKEQDGEVDQYWTEFLEDVDGRGTSLSAFARRLLISSILYGHAGCLVDYPSREAAPSLQAERLAGLRPYFKQCDCKQIIGWRFDDKNPLAPVDQVRINEYVSVPFGEFGDKTIRQIRVLEPGKYRVFRRESDRDANTPGGSQGWYVHEEGPISLDVVPLALTYSQKISDFVSTPPLLALANINIQHAQRAADLQHSLHVAAMPIMVMKGFDDAPDPAGLSVNNAILLPPEGDCFMVEPASQSFDSQQAYLDKLEEQMSALGISTLFQQKMGAETAESKKLSRTDSDSLLSIVSRDLQAMLQTAFEMAGAVRRQGSTIGAARSRLRPAAPSMAIKSVSICSFGRMVRLLKKLCLARLRKARFCLTLMLKKKSNSHHKRSWTTCSSKACQVRLLHQQMLRATSVVMIKSVSKSLTVCARRLHRVKKTTMKTDLDWANKTVI